MRFMPKGILVIFCVPFVISTAYLWLTVYDVHNGAGELIALFVASPANPFSQFLNLKQHFFKMTIE